MSYINNYYKSEGILSDLSNIKDGLFTFIHCMKVLGKTKNFMKDKYTYVISKIVQICLNISNMIKDFSVSNITHFAITLYESISNLFTLYKAESLESLALAGASLFLPPSIMEIVRRMQLLGGIKMLQDVTIFNKFLEYIALVLQEIINIFKMILPEPLSRILDVLKTWTSKRNILSHAQSVISTSQSNSRCMMNPFFREEIKKLNIDWFGSPELVDWAKHSQFVKNIEHGLVALEKSVLAQENTTRPEPAMFVFEGPPGCFKSVTMGLVIKALDEPAYAHNIKSTMDGKDFYDTYEQQPLFYMDDVGQQGISQWRTFINWVSNMNFKLDCADAKLKDTKYFLSDKILLTTNRFTTINRSSICKNDGIDDITALWRRGLVFDFSRARRVGSVLEGEISFLHYNMQKEIWVNNFPDEMLAFMKDNNITLPTTIRTEGRRIKYVGWITQIIQIISAIKKHQSVSHDLTSEELLEIKRDFSLPKDVYYTAQSLFQTNYFEAFKEWATTIIQDLLLDYENVPALLLGGILLSTLIGLGTIGYKKYKNSDPIFNAELLEVIESQLESSNRTPSALIQAVNRNMFFVELEGDSSSLESCALVSGHYCLVPYHSLPTGDTITVSLFKEPKNKYYVIDHTTGKVVYVNKNDDIAIIELPKNIPSFFKNLSKLFKEEPLSKEGAWLTTPKGSIPLLEKLVPRVGTFTYKYPHSTDEGVLSDKDLEYNFHAAGLCGSVVVDERTGIKGMHVAGSFQTGVSLLWSQQLRKDVSHILSEDSYISDLTYKEITTPVDVSGMKLDVKMNVFTNNKSNIIPSPMHGVLETTRSPANLNKYGPHTIKDIGKKSFLPQKGVNSEELKFAQNYVSTLISPFSKISEKEVIMGNNILAPINKKSSNGFSMISGKENYIDFEKGEYTILGKETLESFKSNTASNNFVLKDWIWTECLKDEIRNDSKLGEPRSFRISPLPLQLATKELTGEFVSNIIRTRDFHNIMIGTNPYKDFDRMHKSLLRCKGIFDGDVGKWDGGMLSQVQYVIAKEIVSKFRGSEQDRDLLDKLMLNMMNTIVAMNDDLWLTTHSMPSGCFLTAIVNSIINQMYSAMWYYRQMKRNNRNPTITGFKKDLLLYVYGDDLLTGVYNHTDILNAITLNEFYTSIGMSFTDGNKQIITQPFSTIEDVTFLKRKFLFHPKIGRIMCPLSIHTLYSGLSYVDKKKDTFDVMRDKIHNFQREIYLHTHLNYDQIVYNVLRVAQSLSIEAPTLSEDYLLYVYSTNEEMEAMSWSSWHTSKYN
jgi:hypothetical protein